MSRQKHKGFTNTTIALIALIMFVILSLGVYILNELEVIDFKKEVSIAIESDERGAQLLSIISAQSEGQHHIEALGIFLEQETRNMQGVTDTFEALYSSYSATVILEDENQTLGDLSAKGTRLATNIPLPGAQPGKTQGELVIKGR